MNTKEGNKSRVHKRQKRTTRTRIMACDSTMGWERQDRRVFCYNAATVSSSTAAILHTKPRIPVPQKRLHEEGWPQNASTLRTNDPTCIQASSRVGSGRTFLVNPRRSTGPTFMYTASHQDATKQRYMGTRVGS